MCKTPSLAWHQVCVIISQVMGIGLCTRLHLHGLLALTLGVPACSAEAPSPRVPPSVVAAPQEAVEVLAKAEASTDVPVPIHPEMSPDTKLRVKGLAARFASPRGSETCDIDALAELRELRQRYGPASPLKEVLIAGFVACDELIAVAELLAEVLGETPTAEQRLVLGVAWLRAVRYEAALKLLRPLAQEQGAKTKAAWSTGFALAYMGKYDEALPWLQGARDSAGGPGGVDAFSLIGLCKLNTGNTQGAIAEFEQGLAANPDHPSLLTMLSRAYTDAGRFEDATRVSEQARSVYAATNASELVQTRLSALSFELRSAWKDKRYGDVEAVIDKMWPDAPYSARRKLLTTRIWVYEKTGRNDEALAARSALAALTSVRPQEGR